MRLIIDIPEDEYNSGTLVNYFGCYSEKLNEVIYNAPTVEMAEDCVKRNDVLDLLQMKYSGKELYKAIYELPPVTPQTKKEQEGSDSE